MIHSLYPCLWFNGNAKEAATFYSTVFEGTQITTDSAMVVKWKIYDKLFMGLNGGPNFSINPSISFFVICHTEKEIDFTWQKLMDGGQALMPLQKYPWSEKYGWCQDQFGVNWQLMLSSENEHPHKIVTSLMFTNPNAGRAEEAIQFYTSLFPKGKIVAISKYEENEGDVPGYIKYSSWEMNGDPFSAMDSSANHDFKFNEGISLVATCDTQAEIDALWSSLTSDGGEESMCGWLKDKFGISWQIIPGELEKIMQDPVKGPKAMQVLMKMKKLIISDLENAS